jgi:hypothetical protein
MAEIESDLSGTFMNEAEQLHLPDLPSPYDHLASWELLQHHGALIRLLDWTRSPFIALWFALNDRNRKPVDDMALWLLNTHYSWMSQQELLVELEAQGYYGWTRILDFRDGRTALAEAAITNASLIPLVVQPRAALVRAAAQQSVLTLVPRVQLPLVNQAYLQELHATKVPLPAA